jgi:hypothetical protein
MNAEHGYSDERGKRSVFREERRSATQICARMQRLRWRKRGTTSVSLLCVLTRKQLSQTWEDNVLLIHLNTVFQSTIYYLYATLIA